MRPNFKKLTSDRFHTHNFKIVLVYVKWEAYTSKLQSYKYSQIIKNLRHTPTKQRMISILNFGRKIRNFEIEEILSNSGFLIQLRK